MRLIATALLLLTSALGHGPDAFAQMEGIRREDQLKAAYLVNFVQFIDWPHGAASDEIRFCFMSGESVHAALRNSMQGKRIGARRLSFHPLEPEAPAAGCHVIYISAGVPASEWPPPQGEGYSALTVGESEGFARSDAGIIELYTEDNRLRFRINVENARRAGLRISSNLLKLATIVSQEDPS